jgi:hypothetical protein
MIIINSEEFEKIFDFNGYSLSFNKYLHKETPEVSGFTKFSNFSSFK